MLAAKRLIQKAVQHHQRKVQHGDLTTEDLDPRIAVHYGVPSTASVLAFDPIQRLLAIGTLDGRIKVIGGDGIEGLLISPNQLPYKHIEFLQNKAYIVSISNDNDIQVWDLESRSIADSLQWASNITAFSVISGSHFMYVGDEHGLMSVIKFEAEDGKLFQLQYHISADSISEAAGFPLPNDQPIIGVLPQLCSSGNRVLLAYQNGLIILWDISEGQILFVGGGKDLQLKDGVVDSSSEVDANLPDATLEHHLEEKEISALCWASSNGSILAVGYIDGDILFWNTSCAASSKSQQASSSNNIVKLQLSSAERRLPVIVLQWSKNQKSHNDCDGQLFIYGGDEIGSEEVLTVVSLEWLTGTLRCVGRAELKLSGSFADMILLPNAGAMGGNQKADLFVLTNPGQLHFYDDASLSALISQRERRPSISAIEFPAVVPSSNPSMTVAKLSKIPTGGDSSKALLEVASVMKLASTVTAVSVAKWPLTGGLPSELSITKNDGVGRIYLAGYSDGSIRIWDATYPVLSLICLLEGEVQGVKVAGSSAPVTKLDFCSISLRLAVGNGYGLVRLYDLKGCSDGTHFHFVTETKNEVHILPQGKGPQCRAVFCLLNSPIQALQFANCGAKLAVGFESGRVAVLDTSSSLVLFWIDGVSCSSFPIISITWKELTYTHSLVKSPKHSETKVPAYSSEEVIFVLTKDARINLFEGGTGKIIGTQPWHLKKPSVAISMYVIAVSISVSESSNEQPESHEDSATKKEPVSNSTTVSINSHEGVQQPSSETACSEERLLDSILLLCCEDSLRLYSTKSVIQGNNKSIRKVKHAKPCCWTATLRKDEKVCGLVLLFQTGVIEIRSLPDLELVKESSLASILRWNFKANMDKMMSSSDNGQITLASGCELAFISLLAGENDFRIPETLPRLHDEVLAAAADAALSFSLNPKNKQGTKPGILGGIIKGFKGRKVPHTEDFILNPKVKFSHLEGIFLKSPFSDSSPAVTDNQEAEELNIDDIEIDEPLPVASSSSYDFQNIKTEKGTERERLFHGGTDDTKPRLRTPEEIIATYRKAGDASSVAAHARDKLVQRQEKLEKISRRTEELQSGAEDFASLANELVKTLEARKKWWHI